MKTKNAILSKWMRRVSGLLATLMLTMSFAGQASAIILFQDDDTHDINSEGININADDGGDEDVTLQFGNDGTDATITFDDGLSDLIYSGAGMDWSSVDMFRIREDADPATNSACTAKGELIYDTTDDELQICTVVGAAGAATWAAVNSGSDADTLDTLDSADFLRATASDSFGDGGVFTLTIGADDTLKVDGTLDANGVVNLGDGGDAATLDSTTLSVDSTDTTNVTMTANDAGAKTFTIDATNTGAGTGNLDINADDAITVDSTNAGVSIDGAAASNFTTSAGALTLDGAGGVNIAGNASEVDVTTTGALDLNSGAFTWDGSTALMTSTNTFGIDSTGAVTIDSDAATTLGGATIGIDSDGGAVSINNNVNQNVNIGTGTSTGTVAIGGGAGSVSIDTTTWDISTAGVATGFTGITSTGVVNFSGATRLALHQGGANPAPCTEGDIFYNTTDNSTYVCTVTGNPGTWTALSSGGADTFESVYAADADKTLTASGTFDVDAVGTVGIDSDAGVTIGGAGISVTSDGGALALTGDGANDIDVSNAGAAIDMDSATYTLDTTSSFSIDGAADPSNISLASNGAGDDLTIAVTGATDSSVVVNSSGTGADAVDINATAGGVTVDSAAGVSIDGAGASNFTTSSGDLSLSATTNSVVVTGAEAAADAVTITASNAAGGVDVNAGTGGVAVDSTGAISLDGAAASNFTTSAGALTLDGAGGVNIAGNAAEVDVTTTGAVDINSAGFTLDGSTVSIDGTDDSNFTVTANDAADKTLTLSATNAGAGAGYVTVGSDTWNVSAAGVGSGFTGFTSTGTVNFSGAGEFRVREVADEAAAACTTVNEIVLDTTEDKLYVCTAVGTPGTWTAATDKVDTMVFEPEYPNYVLWGDGGSNNGKMEALYDNANREHYYRWTTKKNAQHDYDIRFRYTLPDDYQSAGNMVLRLRNDTNVAADNAVTWTVRNDTDNATCHADGSTTAAAANTWESVTITGAEIETGCTGGTALDPGDVIEVILHLMADNSNSGGTDVGTLSFAYTN